MESLFCRTGRNNSGYNLSSIDTIHSLNQNSGVTNSNSVRTSCCIAGGGPAGIVLGYLLARAGVPVIVLEKHADFLRDFRGDTVHPSTLEVMYELGLLDSFLKRPHQVVKSLFAVVNGHSVKVGSLEHLHTRCKFIALMPQWEFLNFLSEEAKKFSSFQLQMESRAVRLIEENGRTVGVGIEDKNGPREIYADLVVAADGRHSDLRQAAKLEVIDMQAPIDVLWMRISRHADDPDATGGRFQDGLLLVMINRNEYWQCAYVFPKGSYDRVRSEGLPQFQKRLLDLAPFLKDRVGELDDWDKIKLLTVQVNRLREWAKKGLLCIGDAAHAMSPVGGVGINLAVQDAVATANLLAQPLLAGAPTLEQLQAIQSRREWPTKMTQSVQIFIQNKILARSLGSTTQNRDLPFALKLIQRLTILQRLPANLFGMGFRPEHADPFLRNAK
jgi:2-polyprenyl-6-methoxyphenol hydroxylase-like FAD-dependent oxidoreductase